MTTTTATWKRLRKSIFVPIFLALVCVTGCKNFFTPITSTGTGTTTTNTGDFAYVASINTASATNPIYTLSGFSVGTGTLTELSGFPLVLPIAPSLAVVNPANSILYVAGETTIYGYTISSTGALTEILNASSEQPLASGNIVSMCISPDGQWLLALDATPLAVTIDEYQIGSSGLLTLATGISYTLTSGDPIVANNIAISPDGNYVAAAVGTGGAVLFSFDTSTGALASTYEAYPSSSSSADQAVTFDPASATLYVARSGTNGGVIPYTIESGGTLSQVAGAPFAVGSGPSSIVIDAAGKYLYVGNRNDSNISGFSIGTGAVLTALSGSPYLAGSNIGTLARDRSGDYILSTAVNGSPDVEMYSFDATSLGKLDVATTASTGDPTEPAGAVAIALTH